MMLARYRLEILALIAIIALCALLLRIGGAGFPGSDNTGSAQISRLTGIPEEGFHPLVWQWIPPGPEVESGLFALQAAIGGICVGWVFGYWKGLKEKG
ncbi:MAG: energy-coupling factor ABC transporter substrate-binding protein [Methanomicrobiales archaeon]|nr:energy-coupling factor ABC transporter substrate-binding protein [Methanomicrobiales archaeon]MDD1663317.1 energy-coupling factor ABC transporter substrate-binding protein [Methanomicrobiales archaeon]